MVNYDLEYIKTPSKRRILGMAFPMRTEGVGGYLTSNENLGALRDGIRQLIMTARGARVMRPDYGTDLRSSVFEPLDASLLATLEDQIVSTIAKYEPRVILKSLQLIPNYEENRLVVSMLITSKDDLLNDELVEVLV